MTLPKTKSIEAPILQELVAVGGKDDLRYLYERLTAYFPQLSLEEINLIKSGEHKNWRLAVQKAGKSLDEQKLLTRKRGLWSITDIGIKAVEEETSGFTLTKLDETETSHIDIQTMLVKIGEILGYYAQMEIEFYDVIWQETISSPRFSHIFEVQSKGNIDSAFAKLKRAYHAQRTNPFLIVSSEKDLNRARKSLKQEFQDIEAVTTILTFAQIQKVYKGLEPTGWIISKFLES